MTVSQLNKQLSTNFKAYITKRGFVKTGALRKSIKFNSTYINLDLKIKLKSLFYIQYLDNGDLVSNFFKETSSREIMRIFYVEAIEDSIT